MQRALINILIAAYATTLMAQGAAAARAPRTGTAPVGSQQTVTPAGAARPSPTPKQTLGNGGLAAQPIVTAPQYSPKGLDFGAVQEGQSAKRTLTLTPATAGVITLSLPKNCYWLAEYREMGPITGASKNSPMGPTKSSLQRQLKVRTTYLPGQAPGNVQWNVGEGSTIQIDLVFQPQPYSLAASGPIPISVLLSGTGPIRPWTVEVPACGIFQKKPALISPPTEGPRSGPQTCSRYLGE